MLKTLASHIKEYTLASIATPICMVFEVFMETLIPFLMASIIDDGVNKGNMKHIYIIGGIMVAVSLLGLLAGFLGGIYGAKASCGFAKILERQCMQKSRPFPFPTLINTQLPV